MRCILDCIRNMKAGPGWITTWEQVNPALSWSKYNRSRFCFCRPVNLSPDFFAVVLVFFVILSEVVNPLHPSPDLPSSGSDLPASRRDEGGAARRVFFSPIAASNPPPYLRRRNGPKRPRTARPWTIVGDGGDGTTTTNIQSCKYKVYLGTVYSSSCYWSPILTDGLCRFLVCWFASLSVCVCLQGYE